MAKANVPSKGLCVCLQRYRYILPIWDDLRYTKGWMMEVVRMFVVKVCSSTLGKTITKKEDKREPHPLYYYVSRLYHDVSTKYAYLDPSPRKISELFKNLYGCSIRYVYYDPEFYFEYELEFETEEDYTMFLLSAQTS